MKYVNSLKYINSFDPAGPGGVSAHRTSELCALLGKVNIGTNCIYIPQGATGHATAVLLESVIKSAGYKVGRIVFSCLCDSRGAVFLDGNIAPIEDYNRSVAELKSAVITNPEKKYCKEEAVFALSLLLCKLHGCDYVILEGASMYNEDVTSLCSPYDMVVIPTVYDGSAEHIVPCCSAIKHGVRETVIGTQKKSIYDMISGACATSGVRLNITSKTSFKTEECSGIRSGFSYGDRSGYTIKSPSLIQRDCAMLVIECALAIRRDGVKLPWASITAGLASASGTGCFEMLSASPLILLDSASNKGEMALFLSTIDEVFGEGALKGFSICVPATATDLLGILEKYEPSALISVGGEPSGTDCDGKFFCKECRDAAKLIMQNMRMGIDTVCFGSVEFELELSSEITKSMNR